MSHNEVLRSVEQSISSKAGNQVPGETLASSVVEAVVAQRASMLNSVERYITVRFRQVLREKLEQEKNILLDIVSAQGKVRAAAKKVSHILHRGFFEQRPLDISLLD
jgi:hypothetical protein